MNIEKIAKDVQEYCSEHFYKQCKSRVIYYDGSAYKLSGDAVNSNSLSYRIIILSESLYFEREATYPIDNKKDLNDILKHEECEFPCCDRLVYQVLESSEGATKVLFWEFSSQDIEMLKNNNVIIPMSLLHFNYKAFTFVNIKIADEAAVVSLFSNRNTLKVSTLSHGSLLSLIEENKYELERQYQRFEYLNKLINGLINVPLSVYKQLLSGVESNSTFDIKRHATQVVIAFIVVQLSMTGYFYWQLNSSTEKLAAIAPQVDSAFLLQKQRNKLQEQVEQVKSALPNQSDPIPYYWHAMKDVYELRKEQKMRFTFHRYRDGVFSFSGLVDDSTMIMKTLLEKEYVVDPKYRMDITKNRYGETYLIDLKIEPQKFTEENLVVEKAVDKNTAVVDRDKKESLKKEDGSE